nr:ribonuclease H-like domain-containing protein [Tanacetum cinerariifolium]
MFDGKADEGFFVGYSTNSKALRVFNSRTRIVEENLHVKFSVNTPNIAESRPNWVFDIDALTKSMNYKPVIAENQSNGSEGTKTCDNVGEEENKDVEDPGNKDSEVPSTEEPRVNHNNINTVSPAGNVAGTEDNVVNENIVYGCVDDPNIPDLEEIRRFGDAKDDDSGADMNNFDTYFQVSLVPTTRIHKDHHLMKGYLEWNGKAAKDEIGTSAHNLNVSAVKLRTSIEMHKYMSKSMERRSSSLKASIKRDLRFGDEGGVDCLSNEIIFEQLTLMGVKRLEKKRRSRTHGLKRLYNVGLSARVESSADEAHLDEEDPSKQERISNIDANHDIHLVNVYRDEDIFGVNDQDDTLVFDADKDLQGEEVVVEEVNAASIATAITAATTTPTISMDDITLAKALIEIKTSRHNAKRIVMQESNMNTEVVESSKKTEEIAQEGNSERARDKLEQEIAKKQRIEDKNESAELKRCLEIVPDDGDDVTIDATPYLLYLEVLRSIVKTKFEKVQPVDNMDSFLMHNLKTMFENHIEDNVWKNQQGVVKVKNWKLYDSCGIHCVTMLNTLYYLFVEKMYPLTHHTVHQMFNDVKLQVDYECEMAYELLRLIKKQLKEGYKEN